MSCQTVETASKTHGWRFIKYQSLRLCLPSVEGQRDFKKSSEEGQSDSTQEDQIPGVGAIGLPEELWVSSSQGPSSRGKLRQSG